METQKCKSVISEDLNPLPKRDEWDNLDTTGKGMNLCAWQILEEHSRENGTNWLVLLCTRPVVSRVLMPRQVR